MHEKSFRLLLKFLYWKPISSVKYPFVVSAIYEDNSSTFLSKALDV